VLRWPAMILGGLAAVLVVGAAALLLLLKAVEPPLPMNADLYALNRPPALTFLDQNGKVAGVRGAIVGKRLKLSEMPPYLPAAFLAMEDRKFYHHHGIDPAGLVRAALVDLKAGHVVQGGSTITQQVVKIVFLSPDRTFSRKLQEIAGAWELEGKLTKDQILELYLNRLYLGSGAYGVDGAAQVYFGKSARDVTVAEAAMLAALTRAPSAFSPRRDLAAAQARADNVLDAMVKDGALKQADIAQARAHPATIADQSDDLARNYFLDAAADEVKLVAPFAKGDLTVSTTLDPALQKTAETQIANALRHAATIHATQAALVAMTPDGAVRALIGGRDYAESAFNRVTQAHRQPGSAFKPFVYLAALEHGLTPATVRVDEPITIKDTLKNWSPDNYNDTHLGPVTLEQAFARSINTVAVQLGQEVGIPNVISVARRLGIQSPLDPYASLALGTSVVTPLELTGAYASFASMGNRVQPYTVVEIRSPDGTVLYHRQPPSTTRVFSEADGLAMNAMMYQTVQWGTGRAAAVPGHEVAGKTGTSTDYRDAWFVGFSPELVTGVWVGNDDFSPMKKVTGGSLPAQIWSGFMRVALKNSPPTPLPRAEPAPEVAQADQQNGGENLIQQGFDRLGNFLGGLFGSSSAPSSQQPRRERTSSTDNATRNSQDATRATEDSTHFFPANPYSSGGSTDNSSTSGNTRSANNSTNDNVGSLPDPVLPPVRRDKGWVKSLDENRRSLPEPQGRRLAEENRDRYRRDLDSSAAANNSSPNYSGQDSSGQNSGQNYRDQNFGGQPYSGPSRYAYQRSNDGRSYRYDDYDPPPMPRRYESMPAPRYEPMPPPMPRWQAPPPPAGYYGRPPADDYYDRPPPPRSYERDMPRDLPYPDER